MSCSSLRLPGPIVPSEARCWEHQVLSGPRGGSEKHARCLGRWKRVTSRREAPVVLSREKGRGSQPHQGKSTALPHLSLRRGSSAVGPHRELVGTWLSRNGSASLLNESAQTCQHCSATSKGVAVAADSGPVKGGPDELARPAGGGALRLGCVSLGPLQIVRADYAAWQAWYEEQQDVPSRLLRILSQGGSALGGYATSWGQPERADAELQRLSQAGASLAALLFFGSSEEKMEREIQFYTDGTVLLTYQLRQDLPLLKEALLHVAGAQNVKVDPRRLARLRRNLVSLLPFLVVVVNTFPMTPIVLTTLLRYVPRDYLMPAAYDEQRLKSYRRLRKRQASQAPSSKSK